MGGENTSSHARRWVVVYVLCFFYFLTLKVETSELNSFRSDLLLCKPIYSSQKYEDADACFHGRDNSFSEQLCYSETLTQAGTLSGRLLTLLPDFIFTLHQSELA